MPKIINHKLKSLIGVTLLASLCSIGCTNNKVTENVTNSVDTDNIQEDVLGKDIANNVVGSTSNSVDNTDTTSNSTKTEYDYSALKSIEEIESLYEANISSIKSGKVLQPNKDESFYNIHNIHYESERIPSAIAWKVYGTERFRSVIEKAAVLSDIANHVTVETANEIFEYVTGEFEVNCLSNNDTAGSNIFLLKILEKHYMNKGFSSDGNVIKVIRTMSEICEDATYSTPYNVPDRLKTNVEIVREALSDLGW